MLGSPPDALLAITATCSRPTPRAERDGCSSPNSLTRASTRCDTSIASPRASSPRRFSPKVGSRRAICWAAASSVSALWRRTGPSVRQLVSPSGRLVGQQRFHLPASFSSWAYCRCFVSCVGLHHPDIVPLSHHAFCRSDWTCLKGVSGRRVQPCSPVPPRGSK